jgi:hypothetical protein
MRISSCLSVLLFTASACIPAGAQSVISARAGVVHFSEGSVLLDGQPIEHQPGKFESLKNGSELCTQDGRAEVLLAPDVFLRLSENSGIRMISNDLTASRVELLKGSALLEASKSPAPSQAHVRLAFKEYNVTLAGTGSVRLDADPPRATVEKGEAEISASDRKTAVKGGESMDLIGNPTLARTVTTPAGALEDWAKKRDNAIETDNQSADKVTDDLDVAGDWEDQNLAGDPGNGVGPSIGSVPYTGLPSVPSTLGNGLGTTVPSPLAINPVTPLYQYGYSALGYPYVYPYAVGYTPLIIRGGYIPLYLRSTLPAGVGSRLPSWRTHVPTSSIGTSVLGSRPSIVTSHPVVTPHVAGPMGIHVGVGRR